MGYMAWRAATGRNGSRAHRVAARRAPSTGPVVPSHTAPIELLRIVGS
jgi:hypothetical protein